jgi:1-aminocyclopropane-1-carboxylate deaminase/D-cysteine desulfhydrase-like pyridoxal-dependent ACC family enzyme
MSFRTSDPIDAQIMPDAEGGFRFSAGPFRSIAYADEGAMATAMAQRFPNAKINGQHVTDRYPQTKAVEAIPPAAPPLAAAARQGYAADLPAALERTLLSPEAKTKKARSRKTTEAAPAMFLEAAEPPDYTPELTPIERRGGMWVKRDDLYCIAGVRGGKVRTCWALAQGSPGLVTAGSRSSPQVNIVAHIAKRLGIPCRVHTPAGELSPEVLAARACGAEVIQHDAGYNNVIIARAREDAAARGFREIPFGMECQEAITQTRKQVIRIPKDAKRIVISVGSGMSLAGLLWGLKEQGITTPVLGICVGSDPTKRLDEYAPPNWRGMAQLTQSGKDYHTEVAAAIEGLKLDPVYEAKCLEWLQPDDLFWVIGIRATAAANLAAPIATEGAKPSLGESPNDEFKGDDMVGPGGDANAPIPPSKYDDLPAEAPLPWETMWK